MTISTQSVQNGVWTSILLREEAPGPVLLSHMGTTIATAEISAAGAGEWMIRVELPASLLNDGIHTATLIEDGNVDPLGHLTMVCGSVLDDDLHGEVSLIRSELDLLKRELRRLGMPADVS